MRAAKIKASRAWRPTSVISSLPGQTPLPPSRLTFMMSFCQGGEALAVTIETSSCLEQCNISRHIPSPTAFEEIAGTILEERISQFGEVIS
jgi:hypothetical protein